MNTHPLEGGSIEYASAQYANCYPEGKLAPFNHGPLARGPIDRQAVDRMLPELNQRASKAARAVRFEATRTENILTGGSCSAIALKIAELAVDLLADSEDEEAVASQVKKEVEEIGKLTRGGRKALRSVQAGFNTIEVDRNQKVQDIAQEKIKALASYHKLHVCSSTQEIGVEDSPSCRESFQKTLKGLSPGVYLMRVLIREDNHKLEQQGHSTVYIKHPQDRELYFDTQLGFWDLSKAGSGSTEKPFLYHSVCSMKKRFAVDECKFHKLERAG